MDAEELVELLQSRDPRGAEELLLHYGPLMRYIINPILRDPQDREECLSQAAMKVWDSIGQYENGRGSWTAWLTALTRNTALNHLRTNRRRRKDENVPMSPETPSQEDTPEEAVLRQERQDALRRAVCQLTPGEKNLFYRKYYYLQPTAQIARELGLTQRAVEGRLYRLKGKLRVLLGGDRDA